MPNSPLPSIWRGSYEPPLGTRLIYGTCMTCCREQMVIFAVYIDLGVVNPDALTISWRIKLVFYTDQSPNAKQFSILIYSFLFPYIRIWSLTYQRNIKPVLVEVGFPVLNQMHLSWAENTPPLLSNVLFNWYAY